MTLHCKTKIKNINLFLFKDQLLLEADTDSNTGEICNIWKCGGNLVTVTYSGCLGDRYASLGVQTLAPTKSYSSFFFSYVLTKNRLKWWSMISQCI